MTWKELFLTLREDVLSDRTQRVEGDDDHLWSDPTLTRYLNEAARRFARRTHCIRDATSQLTQIPLVPYQKEYPLDPTIISVLSARFMGNGQFVNGAFVNGTTTWSGTPAVSKFTPGVVGGLKVYPDNIDLARGGHSQFAGYRPPETTYFDVNAFNINQPGKPLAFSTDDETVADATGSQGRVVMRVFPVPSIDYATNCTVALRVSRTPLNVLTGDNLETTPEIPEDYHLALVDYAAYLALRIVDHDAGDPVRAAEYEASFNRKVEEAKRETVRKMFTPQPWGFGRNGYTFVGN